MERPATVKESLTVQKEGQRTVQRRVEFFNLDAIISVGYRVKSHRGTQFRIWATQRLREYIVKGFILDDERLKRAGGGNYFDELLARVRGRRRVTPMHEFDNYSPIPSNRTSGVSIRSGGESCN